MKRGLHSMFVVYPEADQYSCSIHPVQIEVTYPDLLSVLST